ncbi:DeoR family glycerol-3-phosphate regulon repressor [Rhizobium sp. BK077]|uniref:DeoR/GlpR family DNA-binding transcription regulator n=1 Tax=unclassified Rhizobium TaxID=2613769 RepID=UPI001618F976|nr:MULTISPECIES: DeoR/GlpR family DNA-binding transcription regulator [unclassified Rhizobium]MBB3302230.1 DeoR family glycerol-3-phosphate regulon repressor [Rhizobium sp. BK112]MBB3371352.1 DeoR family glycerol-3-phosphate regulon repressor [Rhizobium sp. BK077]MBB4182159.1 DeoR family glycerol-3-phosphate regulon repressor [Rhizobium sp. BK109]MBB4255589.1 DeoR family glycerol-3-phosphate regulon repressor [Rhizobium sp. BK008]
MSSEIRKEIILERLGRDQRVSVVELSAEFGVSGETIRRDLKNLEAEGAVRRVHGGAIPAGRTADTPITERIKLNSVEKDAVAGVARNLINDDCVIFLDTGTTTLALARRLIGFKKLRLYTNSLMIAQAACQHFGVSVHVTPGNLRPIEQDLVGYDTLSYIQQFHFDMVFMGAAAINVEYGFMDYEEDEARIRQILIRRSSRSVMLADHSKFGRVGNVITAPFEEIGTLVTDRRPPEDILGAVRAEELEIIHA